jgi:hypothetical protein
MKLHYKVKLTIIDTQSYFVHPEENAFIYTFMCAHMCTNIHTSTYIHVYVYACMRTRVHKHTHITYIHTYTHQDYIYQYFTNLPLSRQACFHESPGITKVLDLIFSKMIEEITNNLVPVSSF